MPMLDHYRPPIFNRGSWEGFYGGWPALMLMDLCKSLPEQYTAEPRVHLGKNFEVDVCTFDVDGGNPIPRLHQFRQQLTPLRVAVTTWSHDRGLNRGPIR